MKEIFALERAYQSAGRRRSLNYGKETRGEETGLAISKMTFGKSEQSDTPSQVSQASQATPNHPNQFTRSPRSHCSRSQHGTRRGRNENILKSETKAHARNAKRKYMKISFHCPSITESLLHAARTYPFPLHCSLCMCQECVPHSKQRHKECKKHNQQNISFTAKLAELHRIAALPTRLLPLPMLQDTFRSFRCTHSVIVRGAAFWRRRAESKFIFIRSPLQTAHNCLYHICMLDARQREKERWRAAFAFEAKREHSTPSSTRGFRSLSPLNVITFTRPGKYVAFFSSLLLLASRIRCFVRRSFHLALIVYAK